MTRTTDPTVRSFGIHEDARLLLFRKIAETFTAPHPTPTGSPRSCSLCIPLWWSLYNTKSPLCTIQCRRVSPLRLVLIAWIEIAFSNHAAVVVKLVQDSVKTVRTTRSSAQTPIRLPFEGTSGVVGDVPSAALPPLPLDVASVSQRHLFDCLGAANSKWSTQSLFKGHLREANPTCFLSAQPVDFPSVNAKLVRICPQCHHPAPKQGIPIWATSRRLRSQKASRQTHRCPHRQDSEV